MFKVFEASLQPKSNEELEHESNRFTVFVLPVETPGVDQTFYECLQELEVSYYTSEHLARLKSLFEVNV